MLCHCDARTHTYGLLSATLTARTVGLGGSRTPPKRASRTQGLHTLCLANLRVQSLPTFLPAYTGLQDSAATGA